MQRSLALVLPLLVVVYLLGMLGAAIALPATDLATRAYLVLQLFALEGDWTTAVEPVPWQLQSARFLAPFATLASLAWVFLARSRIALENLASRFARDHVVCVGLNDTSWAFLLAGRAAGRRITVVVDHADEQLVSQARGLGHRVIAVDRIDDAALLRAGVHRAGHLVVFTEQDGENVEVALRVKRMLVNQGGRSAPLQIRLHLGDTRLANRLEDYPKFFEHYDVAEVGFFNVQERSARRLFTDHAMERFADVLGAERVHLAIFGRGPLPEAVLLHALRHAHYADGAPPRITLFCERAADAHASFEAANPHACEAGEIDWVETSFADGEVARALPDDILSRVTSYIVCLDPDVRALRYTLALRKAVLSGRGENGPIFVAMRRSRGLARLIESGTGEPEVPDGIYPFGMLEDVLSADQVLDERQDMLARALHADYLAGLGDPTEPVGLPQASHRPWSHLPEVYRRENRDEADHLEVKLRSVDRRLDRRATRGELEPDEIRALAGLEQRRWVATRRTHGWQHAAQRSDLQKLHDAILPFEALPPELQARNLDAQARLPALLQERAGIGATPIIQIGITGHRPDRLPADTGTLERVLRRTLEAVAAEHPGAGIVVLSALAEGIDRMAARIALDHLGARLHVPLPLPYELYQQSFGTADGRGRAASAAEFRALVGRAESYFELPLRFGSYEAMAAPGAEPLRARQYALAGAWIVSRSQEFVAVWDGAPARGEGATAQLVNWRRGGIPDPYRYPDRFFPPRIMRAPWVVPADPPADWTPQRSEPHAAGAP